jgi:hypothetical protein
VNPFLDKEETTDCLNEVANTLARFMCGIVNKDGKTILVKIEGPGRLRALAEIEEVSPLNMEFRRFIPKAETKVTQ